MTRPLKPPRRAGTRRGAGRAATGGAVSRVVFVGAPDRAAAIAAGADAPVNLDLDEITAETLAGLGAELVLSPLVTEQFDCFDVAQALVEAGFRGRYRAVVQRVPDPALVRREVALHSPELDFDIVQLEAPGPGGAPVQ